MEYQIPKPPSEVLHPQKVYTLTESQLYWLLYWAGLEIACTAQETQKKGIAILNQYVITPIITKVLREDFEGRLALYAKQQNPLI